MMMMMRRGVGIRRLKVWMMKGKRTMTATKINNKSTHQVFNQAKEEYVDINAFECDYALTSRANAYVGDVDDRETLRKYGEVCGSRSMMERVMRANENIPKLMTHDRFGHRIDRVSYDPSYHELMADAVRFGVSNFAWKNKNHEDSHVTRAILSMIHYKTESGTGCPLTMSYAAVPCLRQSEDPLVQQILQGVERSESYDMRDIPVYEKTGAMVGMSMTEKQGGSDVRTNTTIAVPIGQKDGKQQHYELRGHKWFTSAPMCDGFLTLAKIEGSEDLSCFLVPRWCNHDTKNEGFRLQRLKTKLGDRSNASSEVEYDGAFGVLIGEPNRGVRCIIEMVSLTRLDCVLGSAALQRQAALYAVHHTSQRSAFGATLSKQPLMRSVLVDLLVESEASASLAIRLARAIDVQYSEHQSQDTRKTERDFARIACAVAKYFVCKRTPTVVAEALESHGGNGYIEDSHMPRFYRQAPLNSIWEGSGNVICLDVIRAKQNIPNLLEELHSTRGVDDRYDTYVDRLTKDLMSMETNLDLGAVRHVVDRAAVALCASSLLGDVSSGVDCENVLEVYLSSRLDDRSYGYNMGSLLNIDNVRFNSIVERASLFDFCS